MKLQILLFVSLVILTNGANIKSIEKNENIAPKSIENYDPESRQLSQIANAVSSVVAAASQIASTAAGVAGLRNSLDNRFGGAPSISIGNSQEFGFYNPFNQYGAYPQQGINLMPFGPYGGFGVYPNIGYGNNLQYLLAPNRIYPDFNRPGQGYALPDFNRLGQEFQSSNLVSPISLGNLIRPENPDKLNNVFNPIPINPNKNKHTSNKGSDDY